MGATRWAAAVVVGSIGLAAVPAAGAKAPKRQVRCHPPTSRVVARSGASVVYLRQTGDDELYGAAVSVMGCWSRYHTPRELAGYDDGGEPTISRYPDGARARFAGRYVALALAHTGAACTKDLQDDPSCTSDLVASFDLHTGARRALGAGAPGASDLALTRAGWIAWVDSTEPTRPAALHATDSTGTRTLDPGPVTALSASGDDVTWTSAGSSHGATLR